MYHQYAELSIEADIQVHEAEAKLLKDVEEAHSATVKLYASYKKALKLSIKKAKVKLLKVKISRLKVSVRAEIDAANEVVESVDDKCKKIVKTVKNKL